MTDPACSSPRDAAFADTAQGLPADPVPLAMALLDQRWPPSPVLAGATGPGALAALSNDHRYLAGRLTQALAVLLAGDLPAMDAPTALLSQALADAIAWRQHWDRSCARCAKSLCRPCSADWDQADRYHVLALMLGAAGDVPSPAQPGLAAQVVAEQAGLRPA